MAEIDHIVVGARTLEEGAAFVEEHLGVKPRPGGVHAGFGTHNMLLGLGRACYLEVIAPDPAQPEPEHPRLFDLDDPAMKLRLEAGPGLIAWVARTPVMDAVVARLGPRAGEVKSMSRGDLSWRMAFPPQRQDMDNLIPALIQWQGEGASARLPDSHARLLRLEGEHPEADSVNAALGERGLEEALKVRRSPHARLVARLRRPDGTEVTLSSG
ncbi:VOC family protein [Belnapia rosea]|uniref:Glyoxalase-like domain-containing protein n=1 Tax=Belnapia rosea TaxID=938405 RepID=A0A1G6LV17_9PROT|nr:VOC family protein [Belnapia rosea]SDB45929.1 Glyoxalase-like domain-containing protein [Belnapia rosea]SDC46937.1 Glyoxalase-like domain-containing protein [Belnapia rosea]